MSEINKKIEYNGISIEFIDATFANSSEENRIVWTTNLAAVSRGKDESANPPKRYASLMREAEGENPSRPLEFLPVEFSGESFSEEAAVTEEAVIKLAKFSHFDMDTDMIYSNMRAMKETGLSYEKIPFNEKIKNFVAFKITAPMFIWAQIVTHTQLSTESQSDRVTHETEYWLPDDLEDRLIKLSKDDSFLAKAAEIQVVDKSELSDEIERGDFPMNAYDFIDCMLNQWPQNDVQLILKSLGYPKEIYNRAPYYFKMKRFVITGWLNNDDAWPHFLRERNAYMNDGGPKNWAQTETQVLVRHMRTLIEHNMDFSIHKALHLASDE